MKLEIKITKDGKTVIDVIDGQDNSCSLITKQFVDKMGSLTDEEKKPEYYNEVQEVALSQN